jgi:hypothetical protein
MSQSKSVHEYLSEIGARGGKAARGAAKRRSPAHYAKMVRARAAQRLKSKATVATKD